MRKLGRIAAFLLCLVLTGFLSAKTPTTLPSRAYRAPDKDGWCHTNYGSFKLDQAALAWHHSGQLSLEGNAGYPFVVVTYRWQDASRYLSTRAEVHSGDTVYRYGRDRNNLMKPDMTGVASSSFQIAMGDAPGATLVVGSGELLNSYGQLEDFCEFPLTLSGEPLEKVEIAWEEERPR